MGSRRSLLLAVLLGASGRAVAAPSLHFDVELRWVVTRLAPALQAGVRDGATVIGTQGAVSPRGAEARVLSTAPEAVRVEALVSLVAQDGQFSHLQLRPPAPAEQALSLDFALALDAQGRPAKLFVAPRAAESQERALRVAVRPRWAGAGRPIMLKLSMAAPDGTELQTQLDLPEGHWRRLASVSDGAADPAPAGTVSSLDAAPRESRELQIRVRRRQP
jgi:hypothetical protein